MYQSTRAPRSEAHAKAFSDWLGARSHERAKVRTAHILSVTGEQKHKAIKLLEASENTPPRFGRNAKAKLGGAAQIPMRIGMSEEVKHFLMGSWLRLHIRAIISIGDLEEDSVLMINSFTKHRAAAQ